MAAKKKTIAKKATQKAVKKPIAKKAKVAAKKAKPKTKVSVKKSPAKKLGKIDKVWGGEYLAFKTMKSYPVFMRLHIR